MLLEDQRALLSLPLLEIEQTVSGPIGLSGNIPSPLGFVGTKREIWRGLQ